jgi:DNA-binding response OmpR family regulator
MSFQKKILIVDDSVTVRSMLAGHLSSGAFEVEEAQNGQEALDRLLAFRPDLIILDIDMPLMGGFETCRRIKSDPATAGIPVMMFTQRDKAGDIIKGIEMGADYFIHKDEGPNELLNRMVEIFSQKKEDLTLSRAFLKKDHLQMLQALFRTINMVVSRRISAIFNARLSEILLNQSLDRVMIEYPFMVEVTVRQGGFLHFSPEFQRGVPSSSMLAEALKKFLEELIILVSRVSGESMAASLKREMEQQLAALFGV